MAFETFKKQRGAASGDPRITIQKRGTLSLNMPAYVALGSPEAVELLYDRENDLLGLRKADPSSDDAYVVRALGRGNSTWLVSGKAFANYYDIRTDIARRWTGRLEEDILIFDLNEPGQDASSNKTRGKPIQVQIT